MIAETGKCLYNAVGAHFVPIDHALQGRHDLSAVHRHQVCVRFPAVALSIVPALRLVNEVVLDVRKRGDSPQSCSRVMRSLQH